MEQDARVIGRQPIFNRDGEIHGFELVPWDPEFGSGEADQARMTARTLVAAYMDAGIETLVGSRPALVAAGLPFLVGKEPLPLPPEQLALVLREGMFVDRALLDGLARLKRRGITIVIDNFRYRADSAPLLTVADYVKLDLSALDERTLSENMRHLDLLGIKVIAERVDGDRQLALARSLSAHLYQGVHLAGVTPCEIPLLPLRRDVAAVVERLVNWPSPDIRRLLRVIVQDPVLIYRMLRFINTATLDGRREIHTVREALETMGAGRLRGWTRLFRCAGLDHPRLGDAGRGALVRGRICSLICRREGRTDPEEAFLAGLLYDLPAQLNLTLDDLVDAIPVSTAIRLALADGAGPLGSALRQASQWMRHRDLPTVV